MRYFSIAVWALAAALITACSQSGSSPTPGAPSYASNANAPIELLVPPRVIIRTKFHGRLAPAIARRGIYVGEYYTTSDNVIGFRKNNRGNGPPICTLSTGANVNLLSADATGHLIVPNAFSGINVYKGPEMCGPLLGTIPDPYGEASSAAAIDAVHGPIIAGQLGLTGYAAGVEICYFSTNKCASLPAPNISALAAVAMDKAQNCYADAIDTSGLVGLWIWPGCKGTGTELTSANGFIEFGYGGVSVDNRGELLVVALSNASSEAHDSTYQPYDSTITRYSGCITGTCKTDGATITLPGVIYSGGLDSKNKHWVDANDSTYMIDIYSYGIGSKWLTYLYSFNNGLSCIYLCESATYSPSSPK